MRRSWELSRLQAACHDRPSPLRLSTSAWEESFSPLEWAIAGGKKTEKGYLKVLGGIIVCTHPMLQALTAGCDTVLSLCAT